MDIGFNQDFNRLDILPSLMIVLLKCENEECLEIHGLGIQFSFLFWSMTIGFPA